MKITLPFQAYSINNYWYNNRQHGKRAEAKEWEYRVNHELQHYQHEFEAIRNTFDPSQNALKITITHVYKSFFNKTKQVSAKCFDLTNTEKALLDLVCNPVNHGKAPYKSPNLAIDDRNVVELVSRKLPGDSDSVTIEIEIIDLPQNSYITPTE